MIQSNIPRPILEAIEEAKTSGEIALVAHRGAIRAWKNCTDASAGYAADRSYAATLHAALYARNRAITLFTRWVHSFLGESE